MGAPRGHPHPRHSATPRRRPSPRAGCCGSRTCSLGLGAEGEAALAAARARGAALARRRRPPRPAGARRSRRRRRPAPRPPAGGPAARALGHPGRARWSATPTRSTPARCCACAASTRPAASPTRWPAARAIHAALDAFVTADRATACPTTPSAVFRAAVRAALAAEAALARGQRHLDRPPRTAPPRWFLDGEAERRARGAPAAREVDGPPRGRRASPRPFAVTARADRIDRRARRLRDLRLQVRQQPHRRPRRAPSTCSCRSRPRSPRPAASRGCRPARRRHLELLKLGKPARRCRSTATPPPRRDLGAASAR